MPYVPPHLRPGYVPTVVEKPDFTGKIHWPTNLNKNTNVIQPLKAYSPKLGHLGMAAKSAMKLTEPIRLNTSPILKPNMPLGYSKFNRAVRRHILKETNRNKKVSRRRSMSYKKKKATRRKRTH